MSEMPVTTGTWNQKLQDTPAPCLTYYGEHRIELSGPVLARWLAKVDNFLTEEFPFGGETFAVPLPRSWQRLVWETGCLLRGWEGLPDAELVVGNDLALLDEVASRGDVAVAQTLEPLAFSWPGDLPAGIIDGAAALLGQADQLLVPSPPTPLWAGQTDLLSGLRPVSGGTRAGDVTLAGARVLTQTSDAALLARQALQLWGAGASVLVIDSDDPEQAARVAEQENVGWILE